MKDNSRRGVIAGFLVSVCAIGFLLWRTNVHDLGIAIRSGHPLWLLPTTILFFVLFAFRALRWSVLLGGVNYTSTWHATMIGYMLNITLPLRIGEVARCWVVSRREGVGFGRALTSVFVERIVDLACVLLLFGAFAQRIPLPAGVRHAAIVGTTTLCAGVLGAIAIAWRPEAVERLARPWLQRVAGARSERWLASFRQVATSLRLGSVRSVVAIIVITAGVWSTTILMATVCMRAFFPGDLQFVRAGLVVVMANLGGALPSAPGGLGIVQGFAISALVIPFGVAESQALAYVLVLSLGQQILLVLLGLISMSRTGTKLTELRTRLSSHARASE